MDVRHKMQANEFQSSLMAYKNMLRANRCYDCSTLKSQRGATNAASWRAKEHADNEQKQMALAGGREEVCGSHIVLESHISALAHQEAADLSVVVPLPWLIRKRQTSVWLYRAATCSGVQFFCCMSGATWPEATRGDEEGREQEWMNEEKKKGKQYSTSLAGLSSSCSILYRFFCFAYFFPPEQTHVPQLNS